MADSNSTSYGIVQFEWYDILSVVLYILVLGLLTFCLIVLVRNRHVLRSFRMTIIRVAFTLALCEFSVRLLYEVLFNTPSLADENYLCWAIGLFTEIFSLGSYTWLLLLTVFYMFVCDNGKGLDRKHHNCFLVTGIALPIIWPGIVLPMTLVSPYFNETNSCWRGQTSTIISIFNFVDNIFLISIGLGYSLLGVRCCYTFTPAFQRFTSVVVPNLKGKANWASVFLGAVFISQVPIAARTFVDHKHDTLVVAAYSVKGIFMAVCIFFMDEDIQRIIFPNIRRERLVEEGSDIGNDGISMDRNVNASDLTDDEIDEMILRYMENQRIVDRDGNISSSIRFPSRENYEVANMLVQQLRSQREARQVDGSSERQAPS